MKKTELLSGKKFTINGESNFGVYQVESPSKNPYLVEYTFSKNLNRFIGEESHALNISKITNTYLIGYTYVVNKRVKIKLRLDELTEFNIKNK